MDNRDIPGISAPDIPEKEVKGVGTATKTDGRLFSALCNNRQQDKIHIGAELGE